MKIAFVVEIFPIISEAFVLNQATGLMDLGHEVEIFSFARGDTRMMHSDVKKYGLLARTTYLWDPSLTVSERILKGPLALSKIFFRNPCTALQSLNFFRFGREAVSLRMLFQASFVIGKEPYDIIHCQFGTAGLKFLPIYNLRILGGKLIVNFRGYDISQFIKQKGIDVYQKLFRDADYFLTNCDYFRKKAVSLGCPKNKISVLGSDIDCNRFAFLERRKPVRSDVKIAFVGRLVEKKGVEYAIRAIAILKQRGYKTKLLIVGDGPLKQKLIRLCRRLNIKNHVIFLGAKNQTQIIEILSTVHLFTAPSVTARTGDQDAPLNVLKEAMATSLPVVSTHHGGIPELVQDSISGFLVPERDALALADRLGYLIDHPERWPKMGRAGRLFVEKNYEHKTLTSQLENIYLNLGNAL